MKTHTKYALRLTSLGALSAIFAVAAWLLLESAPASKRKAAVKQTPLVDVIEIQPMVQSIQVKGYGHVRAAREIEIRPQVGGKIIAMHPEFEPGGIIPAGEALVKIETVDFELELATARAKVAEALAEIALEQGKSVVAQEELTLLQDSIRLDVKSRDLTLRKPQLQQVQAELAMARQQLKKAELNLKRSTIRLPFDVVILEFNRSESEILAVRELVGTAVRVDSYWLDLHLQTHQLDRLKIPQQNQPGSMATIIATDGVTYNAQVVRIRPDISTGSRLGSAILAISDPFSRLSANQHRPPLAIGSYVQVSVNTGHLENVVKVPRNAVRDNQRIFVADEKNILRVHQADIVWALEDAYLLKPDFNQGDRIIVSRSVSLTPGSQLRVRLEKSKETLPEATLPESTSTLSIVQ